MCRNLWVQANYAQIDLKVLNLTRGDLLQTWIVSFFKLSIPLPTQLNSQNLLTYHWFTPRSSVGAPIYHPGKLFSDQSPGAYNLLLDETALQEETWLASHLAQVHRYTRHILPSPGCHFASFSLLKKKKNTLATIYMLYPTSCTCFLFLPVFHKAPSSKGITVMCQSSPGSLDFYLYEYSQASGHHL